MDNDGEIYKRMVDEQAIRISELIKDLELIGIICIGKDLVQTSDEANDSIYEIVKKYVDL